LQETRDRGRRRRAAAVAGAAALAAVLATALLSLALSAGRGEAQDGSGEAKNVIFAMGDGMGQAHRDAIQLSKVGPYERLVMDRLPYEGMVGTNAADPETFVTDSAAGATSYATGVKTYNGAIGVDKDGEAVPTIIEKAKAAGKAVGIVTTSQVTDASPAGFAAHVEDRGEQSEIARQYIEETKVDVILGGGEDRWYPEGNEGAYPDDPEGGEESRSDRGNLVNRAKRLGYDYVSDPADLGDANGPKLLGLFANEEMFQQAPEGEGAEYSPDPTLRRMTSKAIETLSRDPQGFFLFVEEEAIDEMSHNNNAPLTLKSGRALDGTVSATRNFAERDGETLLIVTADHECGGLAIEGPDDPEFPDESGGNEGSENANLSVEDGPFRAADSDYEFVMDWTTTGHTAVDVPLTATGPEAEKLTGNYENTEVFDVMNEAYGFPRSGREAPGG
jgi:alkaline phosphatase